MNALPTSSRIAVVGSGMAGLAAGWLAARAGHRVVLYEAQARRGMDAHTLRVPSPAGPDGAGLVDVPLRVMSPHAWRSVLGLAHEVGVDTFAVDTFASFTWTHGRTWLRNGALKVGKRLLPFIDSPRFINADAAAVGVGLLRLATTGTIPDDLTLGELARTKRWPDTFFRAFLLPLLTTICTCDENTLLRWPARNLLNLFQQIMFGKTLRRLVGGTPALVDGLVKALEVRAPERVVAVTPGPDGVTIATASGTRDIFDAAFIATQANHVRNFLDPSLTREAALLGRFRYDSGELVVHRDPRFMPPRKDDWTALNYLVDRDKARSMFTVWVNPVEPTLAGAEPVFQTWNPFFAPASDSIVARVALQRAVVDADTAGAQADLEVLHAEAGRRVFFCGSFAAPGVPLLESAVRSAVAVAGRVGIAAPASLS